MNTVERADGTQLVVEEIAYHRNGVSGNGFYVVKFAEPAEERQMLAVIFAADEGLDFTGDCAVFDRKLLGRDIITFGENSWRGDHYETALRHVIAEWETQRFAALTTPA